MPQTNPQSGLPPCSQPLVPTALFPLPSRVLSGNCLIVGVRPCPKGYLPTCSRSHSAVVVDSLHFLRHRTRSRIPSSCDCPSLSVPSPDPNAPFQQLVAPAPVSQPPCPTTLFSLLLIPWTTKHVPHHFVAGDCPWCRRSVHVRLCLPFLCRPHLVHLPPARFFLRSPTRSSLSISFALIYASVPLSIALQLFHI